MRARAHNISAMPPKRNDQDQQKRKRKRKVRTEGKNATFLILGPMGHVILTSSSKFRLLPPRRSHPLHLAKAATQNQKPRHRQN